MDNWRFSRAFRFFCLTTTDTFARLAAQKLTERLSEDGYADFLARYREKTVWWGTRAQLTWMLELLTEDASSLPLDGWRIDAMMTAAHSGYINQSLMLWGRGGVPVALGRQTMVVFG